MEGGASNPLLSSRLHDFGFRGCTCLEQSVLGGVAHLLNFDGSDTLSAAYYAQVRGHFGCSGMTVNRDVNASRLYQKLSGSQQSVSSVIAQEPAACALVRAPSAAGEGLVVDKIGKGLGLTPHRSMTKVTPH